jgi:hypothetical protein
MPTATPIKGNYPAVSDHEGDVSYSLTIVCHFFFGSLTSVQGFDIVDGSLILLDLKYVFPFEAGSWNAVVDARRSDPGVRAPPGVPGIDPGVANGFLFEILAGDLGAENGKLSAVGVVKAGRSDVAGFSDGSSLLLLQPMIAGDDGLVQR